MELRSPEGGLVSVSDKFGEKLLGRGYSRIDAESHADGSNDQSEGEDTREPVKDAPELPQAPEEASQRPDVATVRAWAKENDVPVSEKGRVAESVYEKYAEAHKS